MTASELLTLAHGRPSGGREVCFYCGCSCDPTHHSADWRSDGFNDWSSVAFPASQYTCQGCVISLDEQLEIPGKDKPQRRRNYSHLVTAHEVKLYTKADLATLRAICLSPPADPWALTLAVSGQRHLLWRAPVNQGSEPYTAQLELERVSYYLADLSERLWLASRIVAAIGKPALEEPLGIGQVLAVAGRYGDDEGPDLCDRWLRVSQEPLSRLASFLSPNKEMSEHEHPATAPAPEARCRRVPARTGGTDRPTGAEGNVGGLQGTRQRVLPLAGEAF